VNEAVAPPTRTQISRTLADGWKKGGCGSGRVGNHGTVCHSVCMFVVLFVVSVGEMKKAGETWPGLI